MKVPVKISGLQVNRVLLPAAAAILFLAVLVSGSGHGLAEEIQPVNIIVHGIEVTSENPPIMMKDRTYLPERFVADILGYPFTWEPKTRTVRMGISKSGVDMVYELPPYTGEALEEPVKIKAKSYPAGYVIDGENTVRWNLNGVINKVTFSFGMPDDHEGKSVGFKLLADGRVIAEQIVYKADGLTDFTFDVSSVRVLTVRYHDGPGGVLVNPRGNQT